MRKKLGLNIDHIATLRQVRKAEYPDPVKAACIAELSGVDGITVHLREDRRHIQDRDVYLLRSILKTRLNLEMALNQDIIEIALKVIPDDVCIVPEKREELTTEGGLNVLKNMKLLKDVIPAMHEKGIVISLFVDPDKQQIEASKEAGADYVEIHTGRYADAESNKLAAKELGQIMESAQYAVSLGLGVNAGHGLNYENVYSIALIDEIETLNIGHSIIARAAFVGLEKAVRDMLTILDRANVDAQKR